MKTLVESLELVINIGSENLSGNKLIETDLNTLGDLSNMILIFIIV